MFYIYLINFHRTINEQNFCNYSKFEYRILFFSGIGVLLVHGVLLNVLWDNTAKNLYRTGFEGMVRGLLCCFNIDLKLFRKFIYFCYDFRLI